MDSADTNDQVDAAAVAPTRPISDGSWRVGNVGLLLIEAVKQGSRDSLEFLFDLPQAREQVDYTDSEHNYETPLMIAAKNGHFDCVKLLISHGADLARSAPQRNLLCKPRHASQMAEKNGHTEVAAYIQQCLQDLKELNTTRAHLEKTVSSVASNSNCSLSELNAFSMSLRNLIWLCKFDVNSPLDEYSPPLIHRAVQANNFCVLLKLLDEFRASEVFSDPKSGESILHTACRTKSDLRFYITLRYPDLLRRRNMKSLAEQPLHVACSNNDISFVSWLFKNILSQESAMDEIDSNIIVIESRPRIESLASLTESKVDSAQQIKAFAKLQSHKSCDRRMTNFHSKRPVLQRVTPINHKAELEASEVESAVSGDLEHSLSLKSGSYDMNSKVSRSPSPSPSVHSLQRMAMDDILQQSPLTLAEVYELLPSLTHNGDSVFHILARKNYLELLTSMLKVAELVHWRTNLSTLLNRYRPKSYLPIEEAIHANNIECMRVILQFMRISGQIHELLQDQLLLEGAVCTANLDAVKVLISYGFHKGLQPAISRAIEIDNNEILRVLLYYQTEVINALEFSHITNKQVRALRHNNGGIKWEGFGLRHINPSWLYDSYDAVGCVAKACSLTQVLLSTDDNHQFFQQLGQNCLDYFSMKVTSPLSRDPSQHLSVITKVNLNKNELTKVPVELFQLPSLSYLQLSNNSLKSLPYSDSFQVKLYTAPISNLDLNHNQLKKIPECLFRDLAHTLTELNASWNVLQDLPPGLWVCPKLKKLKLGHNQLSRLHSLSSSRYFDDQAFSTSVMSSFTVSNGALVCNNPLKDENLQQIEEYFHKLADFRQTVLTVRLPFNVSVSNPNTAMNDVIDVHLARMEFYRTSSNAPHPSSTSTPTMLGEGLFSMDNLEEIDSSPFVLEELDISCNNFTKFPWDLPCIAPRLKKLQLQCNQLQKLDIIHSLPKKIESLWLGRNNITTLHDDRPKSQPCGHPFRLLTNPEIGDSHDRHCLHCRHKILDDLLLLSVNQNQLRDFPTVQSTSEVSSQTVETLYPNLSILSLENNRLQNFPPDLHYLTKLSSVKLSHNEISVLPPEVGRLNAQQLYILKMDGMNIRNIPPHLLQKSTPRLLLNYLKAIQQNSKPYRRVKLMVVGDSKKGKSSLLRRLTKKGKFKDEELTCSMSSKLPDPDTAASVVIKYWKYAPRSKTKITFMIWDFVGREEYYPIHQCFLSNRSLYLLVWNVEDGEEGVKGLKTWLENIEACASKSPVIIVGTKMNLIHESQREKVKGRFSRLIHELYVDYSHSAYQYPQIEQILFVNNQEDVDRLRDYIHDFASKYKLADVNDLSTHSVVDQVIPAFYLQLQDIIHSLAYDCRSRNKVPIYDKKTYRTAVQNAGFEGNADELDEATTFWHENRILLHFEDSSLLSEFYFLDPQWLCSNLTKVVNVRQDIAPHKNGFLLKEHLEQILGAKYLKELIALMEKFEMILFLDDRHLVVPSLLPQEKIQSCPVFSRNATAKCLEDSAVLLQCVPSTPICQTPHPLLVRYYLLPFVPNGFFARVIARLMSTNMIDYIQKSLQTGPLDDGLTNQAHWKCWRDGITIVWHHMEIFSVSPVTFPLPGTSETHLISSEGDKAVLTGKGVEIKVAVLPEEINVKSSCYPNEHANVSVNSHCRATWLLHQATTIINSVFEDFELFAKDMSFDLMSLTANACIECLKHVNRSNSVTLTDSSEQQVGTHLNTSTSEMPIFYMFSSPYCCRVIADGSLDLECPLHGKHGVNIIAPDLVFCDFPSSLVFTDPDALAIGQSLGGGGFGSVYQASLRRENIFGQSHLLDVAVKEFHTNEIQTGTKSVSILAEENAWETYKNASLEARVMVQLQHPHILNLIGVTLRPLKLLVELAPMGDIKSCIQKFKKASIRLRRTTIKTALIQVAEAINYLHSNLFVYRDLKPGNILVWEFPEPDTQWSTDVPIWLKVADYGISKQVSPAGLRGESGTPPFLPPEVILPGGRAAYSTKIDVYAFGMFMYYLMTFLSPFESTLDRPLSALLEEGRRPELPTKLHPQSLQLYELMCWCWSDKPQHRPTFEQILEILKKPAFTYLLEAVPVTSSKIDQVTTAGLKFTTTPPKIHAQSATAASVDNLFNSTVKKIMSPVEVWYGTKNGSCGVIGFHQPFTTKTFKIPSDDKLYVSNISTIGGNIWITTIGAGLYIYKVHTHNPIASWGLEQKCQIFKLLHIKKTNSVLVLAHEGMYAFDAVIRTPLAEPFQHKLYIPKSGLLEYNEGVVIPAGGNLNEPEIWVCCRTGHGYSILHYETFDVVDEISTGEVIHKARVVRQMQTIMMNGRRYLAVANRHLIENWDVREREKRGEFDIAVYCSEFCGDQKHKCRITTMTFSGDLLYVGTGGGVLLAIRYTTMELQFSYRAYNGPIRNLFLVSPEQQTKVFTRYMSGDIPNIGASIIPSRTEKNGETSHSIDSRNPPSTLNLKQMEPLPAERTVLISLGVGYRGVVGDSENCPQDFILPSVGKKVATKPARPNKDGGHLLLWSTNLEHLNRRLNRIESSP